MLEPGETIKSHVVKPEVLKECLVYYRQVTNKKVNMFSNAGCLSIVNIHTCSSRVSIFDNTVYSIICIQY